MSISEKKQRVRIDLNASVNESLTFRQNRYLPTFVALPSEPKNYVPILYTFRTKLKNKCSKLFKNIPTKAPPYHILLDHTLAVVWTLFSNGDKTGLGINQLQWALYFLKMIINSEGAHPKDVQLAIDAAEDYLVSEYAEISEESAVYATTKYDGPISEAEKAKPPPFSVNYAQMIDRYPGPPCLDSESEIFDKDLLDELENVKMLVGIDSVDMTKVASKEQVLNILTDLQQEQIEKITKEMKMLYVVEDMLKNTDTENFKGYTDEKQFENILKKSPE